MDRKKCGEPRRVFRYMAVLLAALLMAAGLLAAAVYPDALKAPGSVLEVEEDGEYSTPEEVALYIHTYGELPGNYISKKDAEALGWSSRQGNLWDVAPGKSIGGSRFGNYEGLLPEAKGRKYYECDVNYEGGYRGGERIVYSNDGLVYYTKDHYKSFELLYGEE